jgi:tetratricopeptide (TPR) repeat protein
MSEKKLIQMRWNRLRAAYRADLPALTASRARELLRECPESGPVWKILGSALIDLARYDEAEQAIKKSMELCPPDRRWIPLSELGHLHKARGNFALAAAWYRRAIETVPQEASGHIFLGGLYARSGRLHEAEMAHRAATRCTQGCRDEAFLNLGLVLRARGRYEEAARCFEQALELDPKYAAARRALRDVRNTLRFLASSAQARNILPAAQGPVADEVHGPVPLAG